jgi:hypothetical protein
MEREAHSRASSVDDGVRPGIGTTLVKWPGLVVLCPVLDLSKEHLKDAVRRGTQIGGSRIK